MPQMVPIIEMKNTTNIPEMCQKANEPIYITKKYSDIELSEQQIKDGIIKDAREALSAVRKKYDLS